MSLSYNLRADIHLPVPVAVWVLGAHFYAVFVPVVLLLALDRYQTTVVALTDYPFMLYVAAGLMMAGSAFEVAQNAIDKWYLTRETASAEGVGFCDLMFYWCIVASQGAVAVACIGGQIWVPVLVLFVVVSFPVVYLRQLAPFAPLAVLGLLAVVAAWWRFDDPVILLQLLLSPLTMYFFSLLLSTGSQVLHGFTTAAASSGVLFLAWGIGGAATGQLQSWLTALLVIALTLILAAALRPVLGRLPATPRPVV